MDDNKKLGLQSFRKNKTERPETFTPENSSSEQRTNPSDTLLSHPEKGFKAKDLPKSIRLPLDTHSAISTIGSIENKKIYEVVTDIVEDYIKKMPPQSRKLVESSIVAIKNSKV